MYHRNIRGKSRNRFTTLNDQNIRISIQDKDYDEIKLNERGLVTSYKSEDATDLEEGTQTWDGNRLTGAMFHSSSDNGSEEGYMELNNIEFVFSSTPFNPYKIALSICSALTKKLY